MPDDYLKLPLICAMNFIIGAAHFGVMLLQADMLRQDSLQINSGASLAIFSTKQSGTLTCSWTAGQVDRWTMSVI